jgi:hypothetical protein
MLADVDEIDVNDDSAELQAIEKEKAEQSRRKSLGITSPKAVPKFLSVSFSEYEFK